MVAKKHFLFSTDSYRSESVKTQERLRRGNSDKIILAVSATRKIYDFKMQIMTTRSSSATYCCEYGVLNRQKTETAVLIVEGKTYRATHLIERRIEYYIGI